MYEGTREKYLCRRKREGIDRGEKSVPVITSRTAGDSSYRYSDCSFRLLRGMSRIRYRYRKICKSAVQVAYNPLRANIGRGVWVKMREMGREKGVRREREGEGVRERETEGERGGRERERDEVFSQSICFDRISNCLS